VSLTLSPQIKILALVGLVLAAALGAGSLVLGRSHSSSSAAQTPVRTHRTATTARHAATPAKAKPAKAAPKTVTKQEAHAAAAAKPATAAAKAAAKPAAKPAAKAAARTTAPAKTAAKQTAAHRTAAHRGNLVDADLPQALQWQLSQHKIVVVSLYDPQANVDSISVAEAHAGAVEAGAGFLLVNVLDNSLAGLLTGVLPGGGLLPDPGVLIYRAPGTLALRIDGFADRDVVAQAAADALAGQTGPTVDASTTG
jgi:FtsZ-interacting cell division protein ZipA